MNASTIGLGALGILATCGLVIACSSSKTDSPPGGSTTATNTAAAVAGATDTHCAGKPVVVASAAACHVTEDAGHDHDHEGGAEDAGAEEASEYGPTNYNSEAEDDECKYHVAWQSTPVTQNTDVTFAIVATNRNDNSPVANAKPYAEVFLDEKTPAPNTPVKTTETSPGNYTIGPVQFNKAGNWNVRFHFNDECTDGPESPHGHVAFFVKVP